MDTFDKLQQAEGNELILQQYRNLFKNSSDALFITDGSFNIVKTNKSFDRLFRSPDASKEDLTLQQVIEKRNTYQEVLDSLALHNISKQMEVRLKDLYGNRIHGLLSVVPMCNEDDELIGYQGILRDETPRIRAQRKLAKAEKVAMTGRMVRVIAHEIRNPLTNITLALANLNNEERTEEEKLMLGMIDNNGARINGLLTELLDSSRPAELELEEIAVVDLLNEAIDLAKDRVKLKEIDLKNSFPKEPLMVRADIQKMKLALNNIFINAIEAMEPNGVLSLAVSKKELGLEIAIADTGKGISQEDVAHLFDPFFSRKQGGTGLGLTAVLSIIQSHEWNIDVESELGEGTTFFITIDP